MQSGRWILGFDYDSGVTLSQEGPFCELGRLGKLIEVAANEIRDPAAGVHVEVLRHGDEQKAVTEMSGADVVLCHMDTGSFLELIQASSAGSVRILAPSSGAGEPSYAAASGVKVLYLRPSYFDMNSEAICEVLRASLDQTLVERICRGSAPAHCQRLFHCGQDTSRDWIRALLVVCQAFLFRVWVRFDGAGAGDSDAGEISPSVRSALEAMGAFRLSADQVEGLCVRIEEEQRLFGEEGFDEWSFLRGQARRRVGAELQADGIPAGRRSVVRGLTESIDAGGAASVDDVARAYLELRQILHSRA